MKTILLDIYVQPGAKKTEISGLHDGKIKVRLQAAPVDGKANKALITFLAKLLGVKQREVQLVHGEKSREKIFSLPETEAVMTLLKKFSMPFKIRN